MTLFEIALAATLLAWASLMVASIHRRNQHKKRRKWRRKWGSSWGRPQA